MIVPDNILALDDRLNPGFSFLKTPTQRRPSHRPTRTGHETKGGHNKGKGRTDRAETEGPRTRSGETDPRGEVGPPRPVVSRKKRKEEKV